MIKFMKRSIYACLLCALLTQVNAEELHLGPISELDLDENSLVVGINRFFYNPQTLRLVSAETGTTVSIASLEAQQWVELTYRYNGESGRNEILRIQLFREAPEVSDEH